MDRQQFVSEVRAVQGELRRFLTALCCGDSAQADDIAQDALMKAYMSLGDYRGAASFKTWIYRIAYNTFVSSRRSVMSTESLDAVRGVSGAESADSGFRYQELYAALSRLSEKERSATVLYYMQGYSTREIAETIGTGEGTVRQQMSRARIHLQKFLENGR